VLNYAALQQIRDEFEKIASGRGDCFLDLGKIEAIDSSGVAALMTLRQQLALQGRALVLIAPARAVSEALSFMRLESFFDSAKNLSEAREMLLTRARESKRSVEFERGGAFRALVWYGEITAVNAEDVWERTRNHIEQAIGWRDASKMPESESLVIDLSVVRFIDSSGLGLMVRAKKFARQAGINLRFTNLQPAVLNVVQIARLEEFLLDQKRERFPLLSQIRAAASNKPQPESEAMVMGK
jgi:anti-anti-sigma factor